MVNDKAVFLIQQYYMYFRFSCIDSPRPDRTMQDIVYKLVPGLFKSKLIPNQSTLTTQLFLCIIMNSEEYPIARNIFEVESQIHNICLLTLSKCLVTPCAHARTG